ncbi:MAG TPA: phosphoribosylaminoimidazolesuccinocarboxamide synthase [Nitrospirae bacterium]|nr:phosphoribosylaminoimidazolesuccinocarboxamide synthase [Nitrospirota bacterium]HDZ87700.1 phosphoribosylaminoimidazolesuccinocarboxamide synthase [Nitrospirota bacterium]
MNRIILRTEFPLLKLLRRGKVRDIYDLGEYLLMVITDRVSAFDVILPNGIPGKGRVLTGISAFWFNHMSDIIENHVVSYDVSEYPAECRDYIDQLEGRSMLVRKAETLPVECIVRGYLSGSGWKEYVERGEICGIKLPPGLKESGRLPEPVFTPSTKAEEGHDINISLDKAISIIGEERAKHVRDISLKIYGKASEIAEKKGIIIADTKFEFGLYNGKMIIIDEILTPDSSRFWSKADYAPGRSQDSFDKQIVRDYLLTLDWNKTYPGPELPENIVKKTAARYQEILEILTS